MAGPEGGEMGVDLLKKAVTAGEFDPATLDAYMDKLMGTDAQKAHDDRTREELKRILAMPEDAPGDALPLALGKEDLPGIIPVVHAKAGATLSKKAAFDAVMLEFEEGKKPVVFGDGSEARVSRNSLTKMTAPKGEGGADKPYVRERILAIQSLSELAAKAFEDPTVKDDGRDPDIASVHEYYAPFKVGDETFRARLFVKQFDESRAGDRKLHSLSLEDIDLEEVPSSRSQSTGVSARLETNIGVNMTGEVSGTDHVPSAGDTITMAQLMSGRKGKDPSLALGPANLAGILSGDALSRIRDPRRMAQVMSRIARDFDELRVRNERALLLSTHKQGKGELKREC